LGRAWREQTPPMQPRRRPKHVQKEQTNANEFIAGSRHFKPEGICSSEFSARYWAPDDQFCRERLILSRITSILNINLELDINVFQNSRSERAVNPGADARFHPFPSPKRGTLILAQLWSNVRGAIKRQVVAHRWTPSTFKNLK